MRIIFIATALLMTTAAIAQDKASQKFHRGHTRQLAAHGAEREAKAMYDKMSRTTGPRVRT
jgi:hypothetical protein